MPSIALRRLARGFAALALASVPATVPAAAQAQGARGPVPPIRHVFVIVLENQSYHVTFGPGSPAPYLADTLVRAGALLRQYYGTGHASLDNYISMVAGLGPTPETQADCGRYVEFRQRGMAAYGQPIGRGCIYPAHVPTIASQLMARHLTWKAYMEDMGNDPTRESATCGHATIGAVDATERAAPRDQYAAKHNPFVYFHGIIDSPVCHTNVVPLTRFEADLRSAATTPNYSLIAPSLCHDGHDRPCANGEPGGLVSANAFLAHWVPLITQSPAFRKGGLLIITFDEASSADASACCHEMSGPNVRYAGTHGPGGGRTGTVVLSPYVRPGTVSDVPYNHYSMLRSVEDVFGLGHIGFAAQRGLRAFGRDVYTRPKGGM